MVDNKTFPNTKKWSFHPLWNWPAAALAISLNRACSLYSYYLTNTKNKLINNSSILILNILALYTKYISNVFRIFFINESNYMDKKESQKTTPNPNSGGMLYFSNEFYNFHHNKTLKGTPDTQRSNTYSNGQL
ncbi:hypothetical protein DBR11_22650 [Pedobacter sp. HMWF019]|uniref:hypothetical protein n=1 Tax=Pedobacter sp. HMWF019 TaxID=2056856 RepID=UPI000D3C7142|nr:hypothetical protein [Pedobacter sp. HMWF019]PTS94740.1 hypothetical protein DBR11_22650 [Pedobacter sp. HMWF019]